MYPTVHCSTIYNNQDMEATSMCINKGMGKKDAVHIHNGILLSHKKNKTMPFAATWMDLEIPILSDVSQAQKDKYHTMSLICGL